MLLHFGHLYADILSAIEVIGVTKKALGWTWSRNKWCPRALDTARYISIASRVVEVAAASACPLSQPDCGILNSIL